MQDKEIKAMTQKDLRATVRRLLREKMVYENKSMLDQREIEKLKTTINDGGLKLKAAYGNGFIDGVRTAQEMYSSEVVKSFRDRRMEELKLSRA